MNMTAQLGEEVYIGCVDIAGCGASVINSVVAPSVEMDIPLKDAKVGLSVSTEQRRQHKVEPVAIKNCRSNDGRMVSLLGINVLEDDDCAPVKVAHAVVSLLRNTPSVQQVTIIGAAHLPSCPQGAVAVATANGAEVPAALKDCAQVPVMKMLKNEMVASLHYWLVASGIPLVMCMVPSNRPAPGGPERRVDAAACGVLSKLMDRLVNVQVDPSVVSKTVMIGSGIKSGPLVDSLMYM